MVICLTGPTGVGKTDTGWALIELASPMVLLDCDWFASRHPFSWTSDDDVASVWHALTAMVKLHVDRGAHRFAVPMTVEMALSFQRHRRELEDCGLGVTAFRLTCDEAILRQRILGRDRDPAQQAAELRAIEGQQWQCKHLGADFPVIDTSRLDDRAVAQQIWNAVNAGDAPSAHQARHLQCPLDADIKPF